LTGDGAAAVRAVQAVVGFDPLVGLAGYAAKDGSARSSDGGGRALAAAGALLGAQTHLPRPSNPGARAEKQGPLPAAAARDRLQRTTESAPVNSTDTISTAISRRLAANGLRPAPGTDGSAVTAPATSAAGSRSRDGGQAPEARAAPPRDATERLATLRRARTRERYARLPTSAMENVTHSRAEAGDTGPEGRSGERSAAARPKHTVATIPNLLDQAPSLARGIAAAMHTATTSTGKPENGARQAGAAMRRETSPGDDGFARRKQSTGPVAIDKLDAQIEPTPAAVPVVVETGFEDNLVSQLIESAYRHGLDLT
jgi:hypothetical protein